VARRKQPKTPSPIGGGWFALPEGITTPDGKTKVQGRDAAYIAAGLDPATTGNRRSDAAKQRRRKATIEERRVRVAALLVRKIPIRTMANRLGVSTATIVTDCAFIREQWRTTQSKTFEAYVLEDLATMEADEYRLRMRYEAEVDPKIKNDIYKLIRGVMSDRRDLLGLNAPEARQVAVTVDAKVDIEEHLFVAGESDEDWENAYRAAQGLPVPA
jgi:hypothetical protein